MRTIIYLSAILIASSNNIVYMKSKFFVALLCLIITFAWDIIEMILKCKK